ncbi:hypothetical protein DICVIV_04428 [Dictyocaulus viviparus]|uniref:DUF7778 domain-containing protein n=1 Tax=Dictyocaulus viviparus TaxID=29172 RepID=A0A0D8XXN4_DICVI|nr:hypothetical protein DICVIV_04428 [Dictyocaulus viviparus]
MVKPLIVDEYDALERRRELLRKAQECQFAAFPKDETRPRNPHVSADEVEGRIRQTIDVIISKSFDDLLFLPPQIKCARLGETLQCCFKRKKLFQRTGKIKRLRVYLTRKDYLIIYKKEDKGLILSMNEVRKTDVATQSVTIEGMKTMVCRYQLVFDFGTLNFFLINECILRWRDAFDSVMDKYSLQNIINTNEAYTPKNLCCTSSNPQKTEDKQLYRHNADPISNVKTSSTLTDELDRSETSSTNRKLPTASSSSDITASSREMNFNEKLQPHEIEEGPFSLRAHLLRRANRNKLALKKQDCEVVENSVDANKDVKKTCPVTSSNNENQNLKHVRATTIAIPEPPAEPVPPLPANPPPTITYSNPLIEPNTTNTNQSPHEIVSYKTAVSSPSFKKIDDVNANDLVLNSDADCQDDVRTAVSLKSIHNGTIMVPPEPSNPNLPVKSIADNTLTPNKKSFKQLLKDDDDTQSKITDPAMVPIKPAQRTIINQANISSSKKLGGTGSNKSADLAVREKPLTSKNLPTRSYNSTPRRDQPHNIPESSLSSAANMKNLHAQMNKKGESFVKHIQHSSDASESFNSSSLTSGEEWWKKSYAA